MRKPQALPMWTAPIQPYGTVMWGASFITGIVVICFGMFAVWLSPLDELKKGSLSIKMFGSFFNQGIDRLYYQFRDTTMITCSFLTT